MIIYVGPLTFGLLEVVTPPLLVEKQLVFVVASVTLPLLSVADVLQLSKSLIQLTDLHLQISCNTPTSGLRSSQETHAKNLVLKKNWTKYLLQKYF